MNRISMTFVSWLALFYMVCGDEFEEAVDASKQRTLAEYPELKQRDSRLFKVVDYMTKNLHEVNAEILTINPDWPFLIATECSKNLAVYEAQIKEQREFLFRGGGADRSPLFRMGRILDGQMNQALSRNDFGEYRRLQQQRDKLARKAWREARESHVVQLEGQVQTNPSIPSSTAGLIETLESLKQITRSESRKRRLQETIDVLKMLPGNGNSVISQKFAADHRIKEKVDRGRAILLEDDSVWLIDPLDMVDALLWLPTDEIVVLESSKGTPGYDYLLVNVNQRSAAHAKLVKN